jgi:site-specific DNA-cytosine methylase
MTARHISQSTTTHSPQDSVAEELASWREQFTINLAKEKCRHSTQDKYSVGIIASGGLLDTLAAIRSGLMPIWGCDIDPIAQRMWRDLVGNDCYGDVLTLPVESIRRPKVLKTGLPCPDYSGLGSKLGASGKSGDLYVKQAEIILQIAPDAAIIEQSGNAPNIHNGEEVRALINKLKEQYFVHVTDRTEGHMGSQYGIPVWHYGDVSTRVRFIIVALHHRLGETAKSFEFPRPQFNSIRHPIAAHIAVQDSEVPERYLMHGTPNNDVKFKYEQPRAGKAHVVGSFGEGPGHSHNPHILHSWMGLMATQLVANGGSRRTLLSWKPGDTIRRTRLTVPIETVRAASVSETYMDWIKQFDRSDEFLRKCINNGVPLRTSCAIDESVIRALITAGSKPDMPASATAIQTDKSSWAHTIWDVQKHRQRERDDPKHAG